VKSRRQLKSGVTRTGHKEPVSDTCSRIFYSCHERGWLFLLRHWKILPCLSTLDPSRWTFCQNREMQTESRGDFGKTKRDLKLERTWRSDTPRCVTAVQCEGAKPEILPWSIILLRYIAKRRKAPFFFNLGSLSCGFPCDKFLVSVRMKLMKMAVFWTVAPCRLVWVYRRLRGLYCLHYQGDE
jgi:hypothetical protein